MGNKYYEYANKETIDNDFDWQEEKNKNMENEIKDILERLKEEDVNISDKYNIDFNKK